MTHLWILVGLMWGADTQDLGILEQNYARTQGESKLQATLDLVKALSATNPQKAAEVFENARPLLDTFPNAKVSAEILSEGCWTYFALGRNDRAMSECQAGLAHQATRNDAELHAAFLNLTGLVYDSQGETTKAFNSMNQALELSRNSRMRGVLYSNSGLMLEDQGAFEQALIQYNQAVEEGKSPSISESDSHYVSATAYLRIGEMNRKLGDFESAVIHQTKALESGRITQYIPDQLESLVYLSRTYLDADNIEQAERFSRQALEVAASVEQKDLHALAKSNAAMVLLESGRIENALQLSQGALEDAAQIGTLEVMRAPTITLARVLLADKQHDSALAMLSSIEKQMRERGRKANLAEVLELRAAILADQGYPDRAYGVLREFNEISSENLEARARQRLSLIQVQMDMDARKREVREAVQSQTIAEIQSRRDRLIRNVSVAGLFAGMLIVALLMSRRSQRRMAVHDREIQRQLQEEVSTRTAQLREETDARRKLEADLLQSQKLDALGQLTGGIAHDFNNLMTVVMGATELVLESQGSRLTDRDRESLEGALSAAESSSQITRQLLTFSRHQHLVPKPVSVGRLLLNMQRILSRTLGASVDLKISTPAEELYCALDEAQLTTALLNLALNAGDAISALGKVTIRIHQDTPPQRTIEANQGYCRIDVEDNGEGMTEDVRTRALEPFFSTKDQGAGTGLGLSMIYGFVRQSRGELAISSKPGTGTTVSIWLPLCSPQSESKSETPQRLDKSQPPPRKILMVEDQPAVRQLASEILRDMGNQVVTAADGEEAQELFTNAGPFDAIISDIVMPGALDGRMLARWIIERDRTVKILLTSGYHEYQGDQLGYPMLSKPYSRQGLGQALNALFDPQPEPVSEAKISVPT